MLQRSVNKAITSRSYLVKNPTLAGKLMLLRQFLPSFLIKPV